MSIYEDVSVILANDNSDEAFRNYGVGGAISKAQKVTISKIITELRNGERISNINNEINEVLASSSISGVFQKSENIADFYFRKGGVEHYFEIKNR